LALAARWVRRRRPCPCVCDRVRVERISWVVALSCAPVLWRAAKDLASAAYIYGQEKLLAGRRLGPAEIYRWIYAGDDWRSPVHRKSVVITENHNWRPASRSLARISIIRFIPCRLADRRALREAETSRQIKG
jgi:hypothetical protein